VEGGKWAKGQSGNPKGAPKIPLALKSAARDFTPQILDALVDIALNGTNENARVRACEVVLERGWGKVKDEADDTDKGEWSVVFKINRDPPPDPQDPTE
jgi:hypothetical protein